MHFYNFFETRSYFVLRETIVRSLSLSLSLFLFLSLYLLTLTQSRYTLNGSLSILYLLTQNTQTHLRFITAD